MEVNKKRVSYYYDSSIGNYYYGPGHPMKPNRVRLANCLVEKYGLYQKMNVLKPIALTGEEMARFHDVDYIDFLENVTLLNQKEYEKAALEFLGKSEHSDCPVFDGLFEFCQLYSGGSLGGAARLNHGQDDVVINWSGGFHHAKKSEAAGFCYVNDIVLAIMELLKFNRRVMYIDIDVHHGDGVEEAFYCTDRVLTLSLHKGGDFFPGTGHIEDVGSDKGRFHALNFPLEYGVSDDTFFAAFRPTVDAAVERFRPEAIVLQCGADSLTGDRLGCFNITCQGHARCVQHVRSLNLPMLVLGGGGYTVRNVARCWAYETAVCLGVDLPDSLPENEFSDYYAPDYRLHIPPARMEDYNTKKYLEETTAELLENLKQIPIAPSGDISSSELDLLKNNKFGKRNVDMAFVSKKRENDGEYYDEQ